MYTLFYRNTRLLALSIILIVVFGVGALLLLPRMEDPLLTQRAATITTIYPGADAERVESLVTEKIEEELKEIEEIKELNSTSNSGVSFIAIELRDEISAAQAATIWARIRDKAADASLLLPPGAMKPEFDRLDIRAHALIVALRWDGAGETNYAVLRRLLKQLKESLDAAQGTERSEIFGDPREEVLVTLDPVAATSMKLSPALVSAKIQASDAKVSAGQIRNRDNQVLLEVSGELDTLTRLSHIPIQTGAAGEFVELSDVATIEKTTVTPPNSKVLVQDSAAVALGVLVRSGTRLDHWNETIQPILSEFRAELPAGVAFDIVFEQAPYVERRMHNLVVNLFQGAAAVMLTVLLLHGMRTAIIIGLTLPLGCLMVLGTMHSLDIPIHQMSFTGMIIALGLMIDNSIVIADEISRRIHAGMTREEAVGKSVRFMLLPMFNATLTTVLSFGPIALMPGPAGEFVGSIGVMTILAVTASMILSLTIIAALVGHTLAESSPSQGWLSRGIGAPWLTRLYERFLDLCFRLPALVVLICVAIPAAGFYSLTLLPEQFFPPADRNQFHIELELPSTNSLAETERLATEIRAELMSREQVEQVAWFLGESAPEFYYNVIPDRKNAANYGQAIVDCKQDCDVRSLIIALQRTLDRKYPQAACLVRQLEQGPPLLRAD